jgi:hypothetical protein
MIVADALLAALISRDDHHWLADSGRAARGRAILVRPRRRAHDAALRSAAAEGHAEYRREDFDLEVALGEASDG